MLSMDLRPLSKRKDNLLYKMDVLESGALSGNCVLNETLLRQNLDEMSPLQSWAPEMKNFVGDGANGHKTEVCASVIVVPPNPSFQMLPFMTRRAVT
jgi:protein O-GlcNAc transferase